MKSNLKVSDVFKSTGFPTYTYVERDNGKNELDLEFSFENSGNVIALTGPSKTGKTTLYHRVLEKLNKKPLIINCVENKSLDEIWMSALDKVNFSHVVSTSKSSQHSAKGSLKTGLLWLFNEIGIEYDYSKTSNENKEYIRSKASPSHLMPLLRSKKIVLVFEDVHYLSESIVKPLSQQWKEFTYSEIPILVVSTDHDFVNMSLHNSDLGGRTTYITLDRWLPIELKKIVNTGFSKLGYEIDDYLASVISTESIGAPTLVHKICLEVLKNRAIRFGRRNTLTEKLEIEQQEIYQIFTYLANTQYPEFSRNIEVITNFVYEDKFQRIKDLVETSSSSPAKYELALSDLVSRSPYFKEMKFKNNLTEEIINEYMENVIQIQEEYRMFLFAWNDQVMKLYVVDPSFVFFVRWKDKVYESMTTNEILNMNRTNLNL